MNNYLISTFTWKEFFLTALLLGFIYFLLYLAREITARFSLFGRFQTRIKNFFKQIYTIYELVALVILAGVFVCIKPGFHGLILFFLGLGSFSYLRSYISGRWIHLDNSITEGVELKIPDLQGVVSKMGRVKMHLQTNEGLHFMSYSQMLRKGYTLVSGDKIGGFYHLELSPKDASKPIKNHRLHLMDLFAGVPYIDWHHKPELFQEENAADTIDAKVLIKEESHLHELIALIKEWGYDCRLVTG